MKSLEELTASDDPAWPEVQAWIRDAKAPVEILPPSLEERGPSLLWLQVTTGSSLGAVAWETGGILVDHGWLRILGSGHPRLPRSILQWNRGRTWHDSDSVRSHVIVADDVIGGHFAVDCGGLGFQAGNVAYFAPDTLGWEPLKFGFSDFLYSSLSGNLADFYRELRWENWEQEVGKLRGDEALSIYPFPFAAGPALGLRHRKAVPVDELYALHQDLERQIRDLPEGAQFRIRMKK